ncbi:formate-dependent phosphoribosylglycinamide formyltransferase [Francisellaceae bacterium]|nr:formate-dependent phosphoribosylglycinamide formyltransferase [Francisellaceae bacterium]
MSFIIGSPFTENAKKMLLLGSGELGKELAIEAQRVGIEIIAVDRYDNAPAMQVSHRSYTVDMQDGEALKDIIDLESPDYIVPEIEAIATEMLVDLEKAGYNVIPTARATRLTMDRQGIRDLAAKELGLKTSPYFFTSDKDAFKKHANELGYPCVVKPVMSSSGKGQSIIKNEEELDQAWQYAIEGSRGKSRKVIVEGFIDFDYEITLLTIRHKDGTSFCNPIGHVQQNGDYVKSWQPHAMSANAIKEAQHIAKTITDNLGGLGLFGVELFVKGDDVYFNEISPRPHDTGMVTMISQNLSEFALHLRAIFGLPIPDIIQTSSGASVALLLAGNSENPTLTGIDDALAIHNVQLRIFGKPEISGKRRMGVVLATGNSTNEALKSAQEAADKISIIS